MNVDPTVVEALQTAHDLEATASEKWHKQEHQWKQGRGKYPGLARWFDRRHKEAFCRQHDLRSVMIGQDLYVGTDLGDTSYTDSPREAIDQAVDLLEELAAAHQVINDVTREAAKETENDTEKAWYRSIRERFHGYAKDLQQIHRKAEQKQQLLADVGLQTFLALHSHKAPCPKCCKKHRRKK
jgi:hypothetical protein